MQNLQHYIDEMEDLEKEASEVSGSWNGDLPGRQEDLAHAADEIVGKAQELKTLLEEFKSL